MSSPSFSPSSLFVVVIVIAVGVCRNPCVRVIVSILIATLPYRCRLRRHCDRQRCYVCTCVCLFAVIICSAAMCVLIIIVYVAMYHHRHDHAGRCVWRRQRCTFVCITVISNTIMCIRRSSAVATKTTTQTHTYTHSGVANDDMAVGAGW